ncbi:long neurotoxin homolog TA-bm16-like isoform X3 [Garra rufa]|uniref:long neurotoxin homolog TA-bm16-like isoform X3 n=1 Tax=Garra rufa TaxID=137080 RepID=UPI003CCEB76E
MDLRIFVAVFLIFLSGGYSLKCYSCVSDLTGSCEAKVDICGDGLSKCVSTKGEQYIGSGKMTIVKKQCARTCEPGAQKLPYGVTETTRCCDTDLCNAADGVYKGPFLLLLSPLFFYFLFH